MKLPGKLYKFLFPRRYKEKYLKYLMETPYLIELRKQILRD